MSRIKGKIPTREQRRILSNAGVTDSTDWLYLETRYVAIDGSKNLTRNSEKRTQTLFINKETGFILRCDSN